MSNYASGNARVGLQVDGGVVIHGGLFMFTDGQQAPSPGYGPGGYDRQGDPGEEETVGGGDYDAEPGLQAGPVNYAGGNVRAAVQAGQVHGQVSRRDGSR